MYARLADADQAAQAQVTAAQAVAHDVTDATRPVAALDAQDQTVAALKRELKAADKLHDAAGKMLDPEYTTVGHATAAKTDQGTVAAEFTGTWTLNADGPVTGRFHSA